MRPYPLSLSLIPDFPPDPIKAPIHQDRRHDPREGEDEVDGLHLREVGEEEEEPQDAQAADAEDGPQSGEGGVAQASHGAGGDFKEGAEGLPQDDHEEPDAGGFDDGGIRGEESGGAWVVQGGEGDDGAACEGEPQGVLPYFLAPREISGAEVLAGKGGGRLAEGTDEVVHEIFVIDGDGISCYHRRAEAVDGGLYEDVRKAEDRALQRRWDADAKDEAGHAFVDGKRGDGKAEGCLGFGKFVERQEGGHGTGHVGGDGDAGDVHMKSQDQEEIQNHIDCAGEEEREEGPLAVTAASKDGGGEVVEQEEGIAQEIQFQIEGCKRKYVLRCVDEGKEWLGDQEADDHARDAQEEREGDGGVHRFPDGR